MKRSIFLFLLFPLIAAGQDSTVNQCKLIRETDPFTKETRISTGFIFIKGGSVTFDADKKEVVVLFSIDGGEKCFDNNSTANIYFEGIKSKTTVRNGGTMNCEGLFQFVFRNSNSTTYLLQKLMTQKISYVLFTNSNKKEFKLEVAPPEQEIIMKLATCLVNESKTLIK